MEAGLETVGTCRARERLPRPSASPRQQERGDTAMGSLIIFTPCWWVFARSGGPAYYGHGLSNYFHALLVRQPEPKVGGASAVGNVM